MIFGFAKEKENRAINIQITFDVDVSDGTCISLLSLQMGMCFSL